MQHHIIEVTNAAFIPHVRNLIEEGRTVRFRAMGWSMRPMIEHARDEVLLGGYGDDTPQRYDVVLAEVGKGHYVLHRIMQIDGDHYTLQGDGNACGVEHCTRANIIAKAIAFYRKGKAEPLYTNSRTWRYYSRTWVALLPMRRILLALYRRWLRLFPA